MGDNLEKRKSARMVDFFKYQGLGNDFIVFDGYQKDLPELILLGDPSYIKRICDRRFGIGSDGIILLLASLSRFSNVFLNIFVYQYLRESGKIIIKHSICIFSNTQVITQYW